MKRALLPALPLTLILAAAAAAELPSPPPIYLVYVDHVQGDEVPEYEAASRALFARLAATEAGKKLEFLAVSGPELGYLFAVPLQSMADYGPAHVDFKAAVDEAGAGEALGAIMARVERMSATLYSYRPDLSYAPAKPRPAESEGPYRRYHYWYVIPGRETEAEAVIADYAALYKARDVDTGWRVYQAMTGPDLPVYVGVESAMSAADLYANEAKIEAMLAEEAAKLSARGLATLRRAETTWGILRPDLSLPAAAEE